jgi:hypothetical protein
MKRILIVVPLLSMLLCGSVLAQNCSTGKYQLTGGMSNQSGSCKQRGITSTLSVSYNYDVSCLYTDGNTLKGQTYFGPKNSSSFYSSLCQNLFFCYGHGGMRYTAATGPTDFNRFFNEGFDEIIDQPRDELACIDGGKRTDFNQCAGQACNSGTTTQPPPPPAPQPPPTGCFAEDTSCNGGGGGVTNPCLNGATATPSGIGTFVAPTCSPIVIDTEGEGFHFTSAAAGVSFDIAGSGHPIQIAWTDSGFHNAFLALPGPDGLVHNGQQLFGNFTPQDPSTRKNGFLALAEFDEPDQGGNGDGVIDDRDAVFSRLRLWIDENHDGISQPEELHTLAEFGVSSIALNYQISNKRDSFGNQFRYRARVNPGQVHDRRDETSEVGRWAYDVFLVAKQ